MLIPSTSAQGAPLGRAAAAREGGRIPRRACPTLAILAVLLAGCSREAEPTTFAVPAAAAARIRMTCPPGTFVGSMTANCPQPLPRRPPPGIPSGQ